MTTTMKMIQKLKKMKMNSKDSYLLLNSEGNLSIKECVKVFLFSVAGSPETNSAFRGQALKKAHRNLSILKTWNHFDCSDWGKTQSFVADEFLRNLIFKLYSQVEQDERVLQSVSQMTSQERLRAKRGDRTEIRGGQIGWIFEKKNEETGKKNKVEGEQEEEDEDDNGGDDRLNSEQGVMDDSDEGEY